KVLRLHPALLSSLCWKNSPETIQAPSLSGLRLRSSLNLAPRPWFWVQATFASPIARGSLSRLSNSRYAWISFGRQSSGFAAEKFKPFSRYCLGLLQSLCNLCVLCAFVVNHQ